MPTYYAYYYAISTSIYHFKQAKIAVVNSNYGNPTIGVLKN